MSTKSEPKTRKTKAAPAPSRNRKAGEAAGQPKRATLVPENLHGEERIESENDLA